MALLERHPATRFGFRVRVWVKATQQREHDVSWIRDHFGVGHVRRNRNCWDWLVKDQSDAEWLLDAVRPYLRIKAQQVELALEILRARIVSIEDLQRIASRADALAALNVRSRGRRQNTAAMIQGFVSRND